MGGQHRGWSGRGAVRHRAFAVAPRCSAHPACACGRTMSRAGDKAMLQRPRGEQSAAKPRGEFVLEWSARAVIVAVFTALAVLNLAGIYHTITLDTPITLDSPERLLAIAARFA